MRDSFILYTEQKAVIDKLTDEQAGKIIKAIYEYAETDKMPKLDNVLDLVITPFKLVLDRNNNKWQDIKKKRSEAGKIGAEIKKQKQAKQANAKFDKQTKANQAVNVNDNVNVNVNDNDNNSASDSCIDGLQKIIDFYNENIGAITPYGLEILTSYAKEMPVDLIIYAMQISVEANKTTIQYIKAILNNWQKANIKTLIDAQKESKKIKKKINYTEREYTADELEELYANINKH